MEINPEDEVKYRRELAKEHLNSAIKRFKAEDWPGVIQASQLAAENAAKTVIAHFHLPSWSHDPSSELKEIISNIPNKLQNEVNKLIKIVETLAPKHGRTSYGITLKGITPTQLYDKHKAEKALSIAYEA
ncbi:MAG: HEPN domain-containing protein [Candidatus Bathyarchaeia archaeon]